MPRKKVNKNLSDRQEKYVEHRSKGLPRDQSAVMAGFADHPMVGKKVEESEAVREALKKQVDELRKKSGVTKEEVLQYLVDAAEMARTVGEPQGMVAAAREIGKMLGFYAPEVKKVEHELGKRALAALEALPDEELLKIAQGRVIDGEFQRVPDDATDVPHVQPDEAPDGVLQED